MGRRSTGSDHSGHVGRGSILPILPPSSRVYWRRGGGGLCRAQHGFAISFCLLVTPAFRRPLATLYDSICTAQCGQQEQCPLLQLECFAFPRSRLLPLPSLRYPAVSLPIRRADDCGVSLTPCDHGPAPPTCIAISGIKNLPASNITRFHGASLRHAGLSKLDKAMWMAGSALLARRSPRNSSPPCSMAGPRSLTMASSAASSVRRATSV